MPTITSRPPSLFTFTSGKWLTRTSLTHELRDILQQCGIQPQHYFSYSIRTGAGTTAAAAGIPAWLIKVLGRWSSDCYERYIRTPQETLLAIPKQLSMNCSNNCRLDRSLLSTWRLLPIILFLGSVRSHFLLSTWLLGFSPYPRPPF